MLLQENRQSDKTLSYCYHAVGIFFFPPPIIYLFKLFGVPVNDL